MQLSQEKKDKISEQILSFLFYISPEQPFTAKIAKELARDEEFIKKLLHDLQNKGLLIPIKKNKKGILFTKRIKWRLSNKAYEAYKQQTT